MKGNLRLITFDGDQTLYSDGQSFDDHRLAHMISQLMRSGVYVAVVTAAGYKFDVEKYEGRLKGLLEWFADHLDPEYMNRFMILGGECNYLLRLNEQNKLEPIPTESWNEEVASWDSEEVNEMLDRCEASMQESVQELNLRARVIRKERSCGVVAGGLEGKLKCPQGSGARKLQREHLDEMVLRIDEEMRVLKPSIHYCAFKGGNDARMDIGNKRVGVVALLRYLQVESHQAIHIGDQFLNTGNDHAARNGTPCVWVRDPTETQYVLRSLLQAIDIDHRIPTYSSPRTVPIIEETELPPELNLNRDELARFIEDEDEEEPPIKKQRKA
jgi:IMP and pyridine-specific 5'-nucleotidase